MLKTRVCALLNIKYPIIQAPMNWISGANLVAAVCNAGGMGTLGPNAGQTVPSSDPEEIKRRIRDEIKKVRSLTDKPFGINIAATADPNLKRFADAYVEVAVEQKVAAAVVIYGPPDIYTDVLKKANIKVLHTVTAPRYAIRAEKKGVDAIITEGFEGGGHIGIEDLTTMTLVPQVVDAVKIPIIAGGGIADARGFLAALALGAEGVYMGTRFLATSESDANPKFKQALIEASGPCTVTVGKKIGAGLTRQLKNDFSKQYLEAELGGATQEELLNILAARSIEEGAPSGSFGRFYRAFVQGDLVEGMPAAGQVSAMLHELKSAEDVINSIIVEAKNILENLNRVGL